MSKKSSEPSLFFLNFQGEFLSILLDTKLTTATDNGEEVSQSEIPMTLQAFLIDEDEHFYYLGGEYNIMDPRTGVDRAVPKSRVLYVEMMKPQDHLTQILDNMETPDKAGAN